MSSLLETIYKKGLAGLREGHEPIPREQAPAAKKPAPDTHEQRLAKESQAWKTGNEIRSKGVTEAVVYGFLKDYNGNGIMREEEEIDHGGGQAYFNGYDPTAKKKGETTKAPVNKRPATPNTSYSSATEPKPKDTRTGYGYDRL